MATKEKLKTKAARVREEARETGKVILRAPALVRAAECVIRFLLGAMLSGAEIFGGYAPFGLGLVAASGSGLTASAPCWGPASAISPSRASPRGCGMWPAASWPSPWPLPSST